MSRGVIFIWKAIYLHSYIYLLCLKILMDIWSFALSHLLRSFRNPPVGRSSSCSIGSCILQLFCRGAGLRVALRGRQLPRRLRQVRERGSGSFGRRSHHASAGASLRVSRECTQPPPLPPRASHRSLHCLPGCGLTGSCSPFLIFFLFGRTSGPVPTWQHLTAKRPTNVPQPHHPFVP